jgi:RNA recognition motif-containing protein
VNIYVGNLSYSATEKDLREAFGKFGAVSSASVIMDKMSGRSRGFGFVEMPNREEGQKAIEALNGADICGRAVRVNEARPKADRESAQGGWENRRGGRSR